MQYLQALALLCSLAEISALGLLAEVGHQGDAHCSQRYNYKPVATTKAKNLSHHNRSTCLFGFMLVCNGPRVRPTECLDIQSKDVKDGLIKKGRRMCRGTNATWVILMQSPIWVSHGPGNYKLKP